MKYFPFLCTFPKVANGTDITKFMSIFQYCKEFDNKKIKEMIYELC